MFLFQTSPDPSARPGWPNRRIGENYNIDIDWTPFITLAFMVAAMVFGIFIIIAAISGAKTRKRRSPKNEYQRQAVPQRLSNISKRAFDNNLRHTLNEGEEALLASRQHWIYGLLAPAVLGSATLVLTVLWLVYRPAPLSLIPLLWLVAAVVAGISMVPWLSIYIMITNQQYHSYKLPPAYIPFLREDHYSLPLERVINFTSKNSWLQGQYNIGDLHIAQLDQAGNRDEALTIAQNMPDIEMVVDIGEAARTAYRWQQEAPRREREAREEHDRQEALALQRQTVRLLQQLNGFDVAEPGDAPDLPPGYEP